MPGLLPQPYGIVRFILFCSNFDARTKVVLHVSPLILFLQGFRLNSLVRKPVLLCLGPEMEYHGNTVEARPVLLDLL